ncbi:hypothetical protein [Burkholderia sp. F1]|uniref:hypothetical protein n=1 Tax=Burkholderia sp. F1 TaxID=3366817 RepID=UPI003D716CD5
MILLVIFCNGITRFEKADNGHRRRTKQGIVPRASHLNTNITLILLAQLPHCVDYHAAILIAHIAPSRVASDLQYPGRRFA